MLVLFSLPRRERDNIVWMPVCSIASYILMAVVVRIFYATNIIAWIAFLDMVFRVRLDKLF